MTLRVEWTSRALKDAGRLDRQVRVRIVEAVERFAETGHGDVRALRGEEGVYRLRVGCWRVLFTYDEDEGDAVVVLLVVRVRHRREAYRS